MKGAAWLDGMPITTAAECRALVEELEPYDLSAGAAVPEVVAVTGEEHTLREAREVIQRLRTFAQACVDLEQGMVMIR